MRCALCSQSRTKSVSCAYLMEQSTHMRPKMLCRSAAALRVVKCLAGAHHEPDN